MGEHRQIVAEIEAAVAPVVNGMGFDLVRVRLTGGRKKTLQIMAEREDGSIDIDDCAEISQAVSAMLDVEGVIRGEYVLEVSSPGIDRPLMKLDDFERYVGHLAKIKVKAPIDGRRTFSGELKAIRNRKIEFDVSDGSVRGQILEVPFDGIEEAQLILTDDLIRESLKGAKENRRTT